MEITTNDVANATKSKNVSDVITLILNAVCENREFSEEEVFLLDECMQKFSKVPFQVFAKYCDPFLELNIFTTNFSVIPESWWRVIYMTLTMNSIRAQQ